ncbi:MAG TPA: hypothetical protein VI027_10660 [Rubrobacteraceae bacterium]
MRKPKWVTVLITMLALVLILALPAMGQVTQEDEQEGESADIDQNFEVSSSGDNSNQCAGIQGASNTGNAQNVIDLLQYVSETDDFEFEEVDSSLDVSPSNTTTCTSEVNQAASAAA